MFARATKLRVFQIVASAIDGTHLSRIVVRRIVGSAPERDALRRDVITRLICDFELDFAQLEERFDVDSERYFDDELVRLIPMAADGLLEVTTHGIRVKPAGRLLIRNVCMVFDAHLGRGKRESGADGSTPTPRFSRTV